MTFAMMVMVVRVDMARDIPVQVSPRTIQENEGTEVRLLMSSTVQNQNVAVTEVLQLRNTFGKIMMNVNITVLNTKIGVVEPQDT